MENLENQLLISEKGEETSHLPDELWKRIFEQLDAKEVYNCKRVSRQFARVIRDNWQRMSRPFMDISIFRPNSTHKLQPKPLGWGCCGELPKGVPPPDTTIPVPDHPKPNEWRIDVRTSFQQKDSYEVRGEMRFVYNKGRLTVKHRGNESRRKGFAILRVCKKYFKQLGYRGLIRMPFFGCLSSCGETEELRIRFASFEDSLIACLRFCVSSQFRLELSAGAGPWQSDDQLFAVVSKFLHQQPLTLEKLSLNGHFTQIGRELTVEAVRGYQGKVFKLTIQAPNCGAYRYYPYYWTVELHENNAQQELHEYAPVFKRPNEHKFYVRSMDSEYHNTFDVMNVIEVAFAEVMVIDIRYGNEKIAPDLVRMFVRQWISGERKIEKISLGVKDMNFRVDLLEVLKEFPSMALPNVEDIEDRVVVHKNNDNINVLMLYRVKISQYNDYEFYYVIEAQTMFEVV